MARLARVVAPGVPHHITQRGNRRQDTFFKREDYQGYIGLMAEGCAYHGVEIWSYCLMRNHVHLIAVPKTGEALGLAIGEAHRRYSRHINNRQGWRGHLWQGRFASFPMDEQYLLTAARYVALNPVRAKMTKQAVDYQWSSARAHVAGQDDDLVRVAPLLDRVADWPGFLDAGKDDDAMEIMQQHERTGRPLGDAQFVESLESSLGRVLRRQRPGPKGAL